MLVRLGRLKIRQKLQLGFGTLILLIGILAVIKVVVHRDDSQDADQQDQRSEAELELLSDLEATEPDQHRGSSPLRSTTRPRPCLGASACLFRLWAIWTELVKPR